MIGRRKTAGILAAAALAAGTANAATPATVQRSHFHKQWDLQFFAPRVPDDPSLRTPDVAPIGKFEIEYPPFRFSFREIWREGREIMMNGHKQRFRTVYSYGANLHGADFLHDIGYNVIHLSHRIEPDPRLDTDFLYGLAERGMGAVVPMPGISYPQQESVWRDPDIAEDYARVIGRNLKRYRNIPSIVLCYFGVNNIVPSWSMNPQWIGGGGTDGWKTELANRTADAGRKVNPNVLFFSHADGNCADIASHNLYLNFTPLQEREEWLSHWSRRGRLPYQAAEFGAPYFQSWYKDGVFLQTEYTAIYYGEDVYRDEPPDILRRTRPSVYIRRVQSPNYWRFIRDFVWRTNRAWRTFGLNGGLVYFNLEEGYGMPGWHYLDKLWNEYGVNYGALKEKVEGRPGWA